MHIYSYQEFKPKYNDTCFIAQGAVVIGKVDLADNVNVWFNCVLRGDVNQITIGENTNIQDLCMLHVTEENSLTVGKNVTIGHSAILHACTIEDGCLIGMGAKVLDGAVIGKNSLVAAGSVVPPGKTYPPGSFIVGSPAKVVRALDPREVEGYSNHYKSYVGYAKDFLDKDIVTKLN